MNFHKTIKFEHEKLLMLFLSVQNARLNNGGLFFSLHAKERIKDRVENLEYCLNFFHSLTLNYEDIIEYTFINGDIEKALFRVAYNNEKDIALIINKHGKICTLYFNNKNDTHETLNKKFYAMA